MFVERIRIQFADIDRENVEMGCCESCDFLNKAATQAVAPEFGENVETADATSSGQTLVRLATQSGNSGDAVAGEAGKKRLACGIEPVCARSKISHQAVDHVVTF